MTASTPARFHDTTPLPLEGVVRVVREAEVQAEQALREGKLVYIRGPRKSGKTSLARRLEHRIRDTPAADAPRLAARLVLTNINQYKAPGDFAAVMEEHELRAFEDVAGRSGLDVAQVEAIRRDAAGDGWLWRALDGLARATDVPVVVFVDEIEELLGNHRPFGEDWLVRLREAHQESLGRVTACVLGQLPASLLVRNAERTPFNTAKEFVLADFDNKQVVEMVRSALITEFEGVDLGVVVARSVYREMGGQPNLTQCVLGKIQQAVEVRPDSIADYADIIRAFIEDDPECQPTTSNTYMAIDGAFSAPGVWPADAGLETYARMLESARYVGGDAAPMIVHDPWEDGQRMLEAIGMAKVEERSPGERFLVVRNRVVRRIFDADWLDRVRLGVTRPEAIPTGAGSATLAAMERIAAAEICSTEWAVQHQARITPGSGREVLEGALFEFEIVRQSPAERLTLQMFKGVGMLGRRLWRHQVRTLRQIVDRSPALPRIYRGSDLPDRGIAYAISQRPVASLADSGALDFVRDRRAWAMDQFESLADGLDCLAEEGIIHRNIWPGSIRFDPPSPGERPAQLKFANFEFAVMLRTVLGTGDDPLQVIGERRAALRRGYLQQPAAARPYAPPEYLRGLFGDPTEPAPTTVTSGVFSLGMIVAAWFLGPPEADAFAQVLPENGSDESYSTEGHAAFVQGVERGIEQAIRAHRIPATLGRLLGEMLRFDPSRRPTPRQVVEELRSHSATIRAWTSGERKPLLACYAYRQTAERLAAAGMITSALGTEESRRDVEAFLERELRNASLFYAPRGIAPYVDNPLPEQHAAQWVLRGQTWLFYCQRFERRRGGLGAAMQTPHILRIAYPWPLNQVWRGLPSEMVALRDFGSLSLAEQSAGSVMEPTNDADYQTWDAALSAATRHIRPPSFEIAKTAFSWVVDAQKEAIELQRFPVRLIGRPTPRTAEYELDVQAYRRWISGNSLRSAVFRAANITDPRDHFEQVMQEACGQGDRQARLRPRTDGESRRWSAAQIEQVTASRIRLSGVLLPDTAHVELRSSFLGRIPLEQQSAAIDELSASPALFDQLLQPHVIVDEGSADDPAIDVAVENLIGRAADVVRKIVSSSPLMALQGPPGTGKTSVTAAVVESLLLRDPTERILITSQSHAAVDNIALRIRELGLHERVICVRVAAEGQFDSGDRIDDWLKGWRPESVAHRLSERIQRTCAKALEAGTDGVMRQAYKHLQYAASVGLLELTDRVREGANLVFATTAGTRRVAREGFLPRGKFDLAIVDEASKAWPTEIIQPMLIADRQLLVGDHRQLPAFGSTSIERLLRQCIASNDEEFRVFANHTDAVQAWLKLFESFFAKGQNRKFVAAGDNDRLPGWRDRSGVAEELDLQFRMRSDIADVVSRSFYNGRLRTDPRVDERARPAWLKEFAEELGAPRGILWIDTPPEHLFQSANPAVNPDQARLCVNLLGKLDQIRPGLGTSEVAVLSPYRQQNEEIRRQLAGHGPSGFLGHVQTADSFQGREADLVILSLVRGPRGDPEKGSPTDRYGFMVQPERVNVMFSRARELLVVLGDFRFFSEAARVERKLNPSSAFDVSFWERLCAGVAERGRLVDHSQLHSDIQVR